MTRTSLATLAAVLAFSMPLSASASTLTNDQINAVIALLQAFKADQTLIAGVTTVLRGGAPPSYYSCINLSRDLTLGSRGSDVTSLQNHLIGQGFLAAGLNTGYYGYLTATAVGKYQIAHGLAASQDAAGYGIVSGATRNALTCATSPPGPTYLTASPTSGPAPLVVTFTVYATSATYFGGETLDYGDGNRTTICNPGYACGTQTITHTYSVPGTYTATLSGATGGSAPTLGQVTVVVGQQYSATLSASPQGGPAPLNVSFAGRNLTSGSPYIIEYGDGANSGPLYAQNSQISTVHTYNAAGTYTAVLEPYVPCMWSNPRCLIATQVLAQTTVAVTAGVPSFSALPYSGRAPLFVCFTGSSSQSSYTIDFGDPYSSVQEVCTNALGGHRYAYPGTYTATLRETSGATRSALVTVTP